MPLVVLQGVERSVWVSYAGKETQVLIGDDNNLDEFRTAVHDKFKNQLLGTDPSQLKFVLPSGKGTVPNLNHAEVSREIVALDERLKMGLLLEHALGRPIGEFRTGTPVNPGKEETIVIEPGGYICWTLWPVDSFADFVLIFVQYCTIMSSGTGSTKWIKKTIPQAQFTFLNVSEPSYIVDASRSMLT